MSRDRAPFGYVVAIDGPVVTFNLNDDHRGQMAAHRAGINSVAEVGARFGVNAGDRLMVMRVKSLAFAEPRDAHRAGVGSNHDYAEPLRNLSAVVVGVIRKTDGRCEFVADSLSSPPLGAEAIPLSDDELGSLLRRELQPKAPIVLGRSIRGGGSLTIGVQDLLSRHVAVLGSTGQGKSCFTAAVLQQLLRLPHPRLVVFDVNGEYAAALAEHAPGAAFKHTVLGSGLKIPYVALGRHGLSRLLMPSEKTQRPALMFALEALDRVITFQEKEGAGLVDSTEPVFFDDCRTQGADKAYQALEKIRTGKATPAKEWPHMSALSALVAESQALTLAKRDAFIYGNIAPLVTRIRRCVDDPQFQRVVDIKGRKPAGATALSWRGEASAFVTEIFGGESVDWKVHVVDLKEVAHDLMPLILGSLLELFAFELFERGPGGTFPTALVLEEAHHYLRRPEVMDESAGLAYERLAKEGRKFGVSLWLSTQRPSEVSATVLAQCGTWVCFRLSGEADTKAVGSATEWADRQEVAQIPGLPRQEALVFGSSVAVPTRIRAADAWPLPKSEDPAFEKWATEAAIQ